MTYVHMQVGRNARGQSTDPLRFKILSDDAGKPSRVRVQRGIRIRSGDLIGSVNRMYHVHLERTLDGDEINPLTLAFADQRDTIPPRIESIQLIDQSGKLFSRKRNGRLIVTRDAGDVSIVVNAYDQVDGNLPRRRLGLYKLGYQIVEREGKPVGGYALPRITIEFNRLPPNREAAKIAYADSSGILAHGHAGTRFDYVVTNIVRDGIARNESWRPADLAPGDYLIRILAADYAGNQAIKGRDLPITIE